MLAGWWIAEDARPSEDALLAQAPTPPPPAPRQTSTQLINAAVASSPATEEPAEPDVQPQVERAPHRDPEKPFIPDRLTLEDRLERAREQTELGTRWDREKPDTEWSRESEGKIKEILLQRGLDADALKQIDCRETICRFRLDAVTDLHKEVGELAKAARALGRESWLMPEEVEGDPARRYTIEVFFPREGYRLSGGGGRINDPERMKHVDAVVDAEPAESQQQAPAPNPTAGVAAPAPAPTTEL